MDTPRHDGGWYRYPLRWSQWREPRYQAKPLSQWIRGLKYDNVNPTDEQRLALQSIGEPAIDWLIGMLKHRDSLLDTNVIIRAEAASALAGIASRPEMSVPALIECARHELDTEVRRNAIDALCQFKSQKQVVVPVLLAFVRDQDLNVWLGAAFGLEDILSPEEKKAQLVPALKQALANRNEAIRENAALFLERIDPEGQSPK